MEQRREQARRAQARRGGRDFAEGFEVLDLEGGAAWEVVVALMQKAPRKRLGAEAALGSPLFGTSALGRSLGRALSAAGDVADQVRPRARCGGRGRAGCAARPRPCARPGACRRSAASRPASHGRQLCGSFIWAWGPVLCAPW